jgi:hypothetical protein
MENETRTDQQNQKGIIDFIKRAWQLLLLGLVMMAFGFYEYKKFNDFEVNGDTINVYAVEKTLYDIFGCWGNLIFFELIGLGLIAYVIYTYSKKNIE